jgi:hypothetical protein
VPPKPKELDKATCTELPGRKPLYFGGDVLRLVGDCCWSFGCVEGPGGCVWPVERTLNIVPTMTLCNFPTVFQAPSNLPPILLRKPACLNLERERTHCGSTQAPIKRGTEPFIRVNDVQNVYERERMGCYPDK